MIDFSRAAASSWRALSALILFLGASTAGAQPTYQVIVHGTIPGVQIKRDVVRSIFLGELTRWTDGTPVRAVDQSLRSPVRASFCEGALGQTPSALNAYWTQRVMTGRVTPPPVKTGDEDVVAFVRNNPGAIGYVAGSATGLDGVKVLKIVD